MSKDNVKTINYAHETHSISIVEVDGGFLAMIRRVFPDGEEITRAVKSSPLPSPLDALNAVARVYSIQYPDFQLKVQQKD